MPIQINIFLKISVFVPSQNYHQNWLDVILDQ